MVSTGTVDATGTKININWGPLKRALVISSLVLEYNVSAARLRIFLIN